MEAKIILAAFVIYSFSGAVVSGLQCYKCEVHPPVSKTEIPRLCNKFNESSLYEVECPFSNYCMKRTFTLPLNSKDVVITMRDCAHQKEMQLVEVNGTSQWEPKIGSEVYQDGCFMKDNHKNKIGPTQVCYCKTPLCNGQNKNQNSQSSDIIAMMIVYNVMKYVRSFQ